MRKERIKDKSVSFIKSTTGTEIVTVFSNGERRIIPGIEPFVNQNHDFIGVIGVYSKNGFLQKETKEFIKKYKDCYKWVYLTASGPYFIKRYKKIYKSYDLVATKDFREAYKFDNNIEINYSMMARSGPEDDGFFFVDEKKEYDFSILTWYGDKKAKAYYDAVKICEGLCKNGYKGIIVTQRGKREDVARHLGKYEKSGLLKILQAEYDGKEFREIMGKAYVGVFPNIQDAFPKHIIECLLDKKCIVISPFLLFGTETLMQLGKEITCVLDMKREESVKRIQEFIDRSKELLDEGMIDPRKEWLTMYGFNSLSKMWADEFNRIWGTQHISVYLMRHINRYKHLL